MTIIKEISASEFNDAFIDFNREDNFSYKGRNALYEYLSDLSDDIGQTIELDIIALCVEYSEYEDLEEFLDEYFTKEQKQEKINDFLEENDYLTEEEKANVLDLEEFKTFMESDLNDNTTLIKIGKDLDEGFIIQNF